MASFTTEFTAGQGGVMTDEVGVITGDVTLRTEVDDDGALVLRVQYTGAEEWYTVTGGRCTLTDPGDAEPVHQLVAGVLRRDN